LAFGAVGAAVAGWARFLGFVFELALAASSAAFALAFFSSSVSKIESS
jgi:hypothetical protein